MNPDVKPYDEFEINGQRFGTGLILPQNKLSAFKDYEVSAPMATVDELIAAGKSKEYLGSKEFDATFIKNQRNYGSCQGFMTAAMSTRARIRRGLPRLDLSGAYVYSLCNGGRDQGSLLEDGMKICQENGVASESTVPWDKVFRNRYDTAKADAEAADNKMFECYVIRSEVELFSAMLYGFDVGVCVHADNGFMKLDSRGVAQGGNGPGNHAVAGDGFWWDGELILDGYNSWDTTYGRDGRMGLTWKQHFSHTTRYSIYYAIRSSIDPKNGPNPPVAEV